MHQTEGFTLTAHAEIRHAWCEVTAHHLTDDRGGFTLIEAFVDSDDDTQDGIPMCDGYADGHLTLAELRAALNALTHGRVCEHVEWTFDRLGRAA